MQATTALEHKAYVAFLDVLGFSKLVSGAHWQQDVKRYLRVVAEAVGEATRHNNPDEHHTSILKSIIVSDSIILWTVPYQSENPVNIDSRMGGLQYLLKAISIIQYRCACEDIWLRGGVSYGDIIYTDSNIAGRAYIKAYQLETVAEFPRVIVDAEMMRDLFQGLSAGEMIQLINEPENSLDTCNGPLYDHTDIVARGTEFKNDYMFFVHYLSKVRLKWEQDDFKNIWSHLRYNMYESSPSVYRKYRWVVEYLQHFSAVANYSSHGEEYCEFSTVMEEAPI